MKLPVRSLKPRRSGLTSIHDIALNTRELENILIDYSDFLDVAKFGVGTAYITPNLSNKIALYKNYDVDVYFGGTLFEKFYHYETFKAYLEFCRNKGVNTVEISEGTIDISIKERCNLVTQAKEEGFKVYSEVGSKDQANIMAPSQWIQEMRLLLEAGADKVITEGRNSGSAGIYRPSGEIREGLIKDISLNLDIDRIIFEAPNPKAQMMFINQFGANVNLGNVSPHGLLLLEAQRNGLRSETFFL